MMHIRTFTAQQWQKFQSTPHRAASVAPAAVVVVAGLASQRRVLDW
jgi:hypothetical protein